MVLPTMLPRFIALRFQHQTYGSGPTYQYLRFNHKNDHELDATLEFSATEGATSPYAKWELEPASSAGTGGEEMVHIRSCHNNKYWVITESSKETHYWITATAIEREEDLSMNSCTLFVPRRHEADVNHIEFLHAKTGFHVCLPADSTYLMASKIPRHSEFEFVDLGSLLILPRYVAFKGDNGKYLYSHGGDELRFSIDEIDDETVPCEIFSHHDGTISIKCIQKKLFWKADDWIHFKSTEKFTPETLFRPFRIGNNTIALKNVAKNSFCKRHSNDFLISGQPNINKYAIFTVEEAVLRREIYGIKYKLDYSRVYDKQVMVLAANSACNHSRDEAKFSVKLSYKTTRTSSWKRADSFKVGASVSFTFGVPFIESGTVTISSEYQHATEWGDMNESSTNMEDVYNVSVPAMTKVMVKVIATHGKCDVPFSFIERDTLYDGSIVSTEVQGGIYTGSNHYDFSFEYKYEPID